MKPVRIGVLALQGAFREHLAILGSLGVKAKEVRLPVQLEGLDGLIIPGGESTVIIRLAEAYGLREAIQQAAVSGMALWGICAGLIAIARDLTGGYPQPFGLLNVTVARNWFGRQLESFEASLAVSGLTPEPFPAVFIRAPAIVGVGSYVEILAALPDGMPVAVRSGKVLGTSFHPELTEDSRVHEFFLRLSGRDNE
ncbi:MAG: pyridoxal 5'-phosphate synthase glutaminase subunit PdxT [Gammaproteobacteria bacterium]